MKVAENDALSLSKGYKQTEVGLIPSDWEVKQLKHICLMKSGSSITSENISDYEKYPCYGGNGLRGYTDSFTHSGKFGLIGRQGALCGNVNFVDEVFFASEHAVVVTPGNNTDIKWLTYILFRMNLNQYSESSAQPGLSVNKISILPISVPPTKAEQTLIATALSDADALINSLEKLIAKKRNIKQGAMQQLLQPKEGWEVKRLGDVVDVLDNLRKPLNEASRQQMRGDIPYCGANGIVGYVDDFIIDDDIILMAEDGGYFDEYKTRPIAYRMIGKCWVNNHAHILKAKKEIDQNFLFYLLVNKNILDFINGGTRAKLNKGELVNILVAVSPTKEEQARIARILLDMDGEIIALETKLEKYQMIKVGMMQNLLIGKIRLV